ncbi:MAG: DUF2071 domain-containing protein [Deltaproteobacteria bacterium]|nr:MAG: DUF2071 domain-containing protein [Deltaproteobacteria bacterium]
MVLHAPTRAEPVIVGYQDWRDLLFIHWRVPATEIAPLVHPRLSVDERDGTGWVSMTPFTLRNGRLRGLPPLPDFHELNFRTYVTHPRHGPGIWFFSLDAANRLAVAAARLSVRLPYFAARMERGEGWYRSADIAELNEDLSVAARMRPLGRPHSCQWSPGVSVAFEHFRPV